MKQENTVRDLAVSVSSTLSPQIKSRRERGWDPSGALLPGWGPWRPHPNRLTTFKLHSCITVTAKIIDDREHLAKWMWPVDRSLFSKAEL